MVLYMLLTSDEYELPIAVADTVVELARLTGSDERTISSGISRHKKRGGFCKWRKVEVEDDDEY